MDRRALASASPGGGEPSRFGWPGAPAAVGTIALRQWGRLRELMVPRSSALLLAQADAARDSRAWPEAIELYRRFVSLHPDRNGLLMQVGHCLKETGLCRSALAEYLAVTDVTEKAEADFQAGELLKLTGNFAAARRAFTRSVAAGHQLAGHELERLTRAQGRVDPGFFLRARESGVQEAELTARLFALELSPLDWRRLAAAAEEAAIRGFAECAALLGDLTLVVGGPIAERRLAYRAIFDASGLWAGRYATELASPAMGRVPPAEALARLVDGLDFAGSPAASGAAVAAAPDPEVEAVHLVEVGSGQLGAELGALAAAAAGLRTALFAESHDPAALVAAVAALAAVPSAGSAAYVSLPEGGAYSIDALLRRVCLNVGAVIAGRLAGQLRAPLAAPAAAFAVPTARATLATCAASDTISAALSLERREEDPAYRQKLADLSALGLLPGAEPGDHGLLFALAEQGRIGPMDYWFAVNASTASAALVAAVAGRVATALKARGALPEALIWAERAAAAMPGPHMAELAMLRKANGDFSGAVAVFCDCLAREPDHELAQTELLSIVRECLTPDEISELAARYPGFGARYRAREEEAARRRSEVTANGASAMPLAVLDIAELQDTLDFGPERLECRQLGWLRSDCGARSVPRLVGVVAIRFCQVTRDPPLRLRIRLDGRTIDLVEPSASGIDGNGAGKYHFNSWIDAAALRPGPALLEACVEHRSSRCTVHEETVIIDALRPGEDYALSDAFIGAPASGEPGDGLVERVLAIPATAREAARTAFDRPVTRVLVMRLDQLGDVSASMPAIRRLRELFPQARLEGLVTPVNAYVLRASGLFDEIFTVDFTYDHGTRRRWLGRGDHAAIRQRYAQQPVDIAIDLSPGEDSRPILMLVEARYRAGFKPHRFAFLDFGIDVLTRDPVNRKEAVSHTAMIGAFVEALAAMFRPPPPRFPVDPALVRHLDPLGLVPQGYIAIHVGARLAIKRWPLHHYVALAGLLRRSTRRDIVMFSDDPLPDEAAASLDAIGGVRVKAGRIDFELFDALVSHASVFVGNDTGPKHLASMRGVKTVSVHMDQVNWNEWGQDGEGLIVSKRIPCCGCGIEDPSECGKAMVCLDGITPSDVAAAVEQVLAR